MNSARILTHPTFDRPSVTNERRRGRPGRLPSNVGDLLNARVCRSLQGRDPTGAKLREWARQNGLNEEASVERIRDWKEEQEAADRAATGSDAAAWAEVERLKSAAFGFTTKFPRRVNSCLNGIDQTPGGNLCFWHNRLNRAEPDEAKEKPLTPLARFLIGVCDGKNEKSNDRLE